MIRLLFPAAIALAFTATALGVTSAAAGWSSTATCIALAAISLLCGAITIWALRLARRTESAHARMEAALRQERLLLDLLMRHSPDLIYFKDRESRFVRISDSVARRLAVSAEEAIGKSDFDFFSEAHASKTRAQELGVMETGEPLIGIEEHEIWLDRGDDTWCETTKVPLRDETGEIVGLLGVNREITERKRAERERGLLQTQRIESLRVLAGGVAHDFNNLLMGVVGNASLALDELPESSSARATIEGIVVAGERAAELANEMLAFSGKGSFVLAPTDLSTVVAETAHLMRRVISKDAELRLEDVPRSLPCIEADETQIRQVVMNLITNASEALADKPGVICVATGAVDLKREQLAAFRFADELDEGSYVFLEVSDTGAGISAESQSRLFEPFFSTKFTGRGLGLAALHGIVRGHGGAVKVESQPGAGATFTVILPAAGPPLAVVEGEEPPPAEAAPAPGLILVADDEDVVRAVTTRMLEQAGFTVLRASDGAEALELYRQRKQDITAAVLDLMMPMHDGSQVLAELRALRPDLPVLLSSGYNEQEIGDTLLGMKRVAFIQKPYTHNDLVGKLHDVIAQPTAVANSP